MAERNALKRQHKAGKVYCTNDEKKLEVTNDARSTNPKGFWRKWIPEKCQDKIRELGLELEEYIYQGSETCFLRCKPDTCSVCFNKVRLIFSMDDKNLLSQFIPSGEKRAGTKKNWSHGWTTMRKDLPKERLLRPSMIRKSAFKMTNLLENVLCA
jgi:hypothetical protein